jgi:hypothetical protein
MMLIIFAVLMLARKSYAAPTTKSPTPAPTTMNTVNASLLNGFLTIGSQSMGYVGMTSRSIQSVITNYFPNPSYKNFVANTAGSVWINGSSKVLSYLTLTGNYLADTPLILPSQFILVLNNAKLTAVWYADVC